MSGSSHNAGTGQPATLGIALAMDRPTYTAGETIEARLTVSNRGGPAVTLHFSSAQRYDFEIQDPQGSTLWRWAVDRMFGQMLGEVTLGSEREELVFLERFPAPRTPGTYRIAGRLIASDRPMSAVTTITVRAEGPS